MRDLNSTARYDTQKSPNHLYAYVVTLLAIAIALF